MSDMQIFYEQICTDRPDAYWQKLHQVRAMSVRLLRRLSSFVVWTPW
jgi:hypothetical protein